MGPGKVRRAKALRWGVLSISCAAGAAADQLVWRPTSGSDLQWTTAGNWHNPLGTVSSTAPIFSDSVRFTNLTTPGPNAPSENILGFADPTSSPPSATDLAVASALVDGYFAYDMSGIPTNLWTLQLARP